MQIIKIEREDAMTAGANEGTFGNVSFGEAVDQEEPHHL